MNSERNITGIILAGGKSKRMGSDKGFYILDGKPFIYYIIEALMPVVNNIIIVSNRPEYDVFKHKRIDDLFQDQGPLAGLYSGLKASKNEDNLVLSCDVPFISTEVLDLLIKASLKKYEVIQLECNGSIMPLIAMYNKQCAPAFLEILKQGERRLQYAVGKRKVSTLHLEKKFEKCVMNINTPQQLNQTKQWN